MKFTVVFSSHEQHDLSFGLVFIPCPVWVQGEKEIINLHPETPAYLPGDLKKLLVAVPALNNLPRASCVLVIHPDGYGSQQDYRLLAEDLAKEGFGFQQVSMQE
jgi:hypothetical protein